MLKTLFISFSIVISFISCGVNETQEVPGAASVFEFSLNEKSNVRVGVINSYNTHVKALVDSELQAGFYSVFWNHSDNNDKKVVEGIYFFELFINGKLIERRTIILEVP